MTDAELIAKARDAAQHAYAPFSHFRVGAVVVAADGTQYTGANVENSAYGSGICAEGSAITRAVSAGVRKIDTVAVACIDALRRRGLNIPAQAVSHGLGAVFWPGRLEVLRQRPLVIVDGAHNRDSARRFRESLTDYFSCRRAFLIIGTSADKDVAGLAAEVAPLAAGAFAVQARHPRAMPSEQLAAALAAAGVKSEGADGVGQALDRAMARAGEHGVICVLGSLFVVAEAREHLLTVGAQESG